MPFAIGPDARLLARIGPGVLWIAALTAALLPIERLIEPDRADGMLDQLFLHGMAEESIALAKIIAHWLTFAPLLLIAAIPASALAGDERRVAQQNRNRASDRNARRSPRLPSPSPRLPPACRAPARLLACCCFRSPFRC